MPGSLESTAGDGLTHSYRHDHGRYEVLARREAAREVEGGNDFRGRIERRHGVLAADGLSLVVVQSR